MSDPDERLDEFARKVWDGAVQSSGETLVVRSEVLAAMVETDPGTARKFFDRQCRIHSCLTENRERQTSGTVLLAIAALYAFRGDNGPTQKLLKLGMLWDS